MSLRRQGSFGFSLALLAASCEDYNCLDLANCASPVVEAGVGTIPAPPDDAGSATVPAESSNAVNADSSQPLTDLLSTEQSTTIPTEPTAPLASSSGEATASETTASETTASDHLPSPGVDSGASFESDAGEKPACVADETTCTQDNRLQRCGAEGQWGEPSDCPFVCAAGECAGECVPEDTACNESGQVIACDADGTWNVIQSCSALCEDGECVDECTDDSYSCAGDVLSRCESGLLVAQETCEFLCDANAGACVGECLPNDTLCIDGQLATCGADALFGAGVECTNVCLGTNCGGECKPEAVRCKSSQVQQTCSANGEWDDEVCEFVCVDDECGGVCIPGARRCLSNGVPSSSGSQSQLCDEDGQWTAITTCVESCQNTQCTGLCELGSPNECVVDDGEPAFRACSDGQWVTQSCDYVCSGGACSGVCEPGAARCNNGARETCSAAGAWGGASCSAGQVCQGEGQCLAKPTISTLTATGTALQAGRLDGKTGVSVAAGTSTTLSWTLSGGAPSSITLAPTSGSAISPGTTSVSVTPAVTTDYTLTVSNAAGTSSKVITTAVIAGGTRKYVRQFGGHGSEEILGLTVDGNGKVLTVGRTDGDYSVGGVNVSAQPFVAVHAVATGAVEKLKPVPTTDAEVLNNIARDGTEFVLVGATSNSQAILRVASNLSITKSSAFQIGGGLQEAYDVSIDSNRRILIGGAGGNAGTASTMTSSFTSRTDRALDAVWAVAFDQGNNIFVGGTAKLQRFASTLSSNPTNAELPELLRVHGLAVDHSGAVLVVGGTNNGGYIGKFSNDLQREEWTLPLTMVGTGVCIDDADNVFVVAYFGDDLGVFAFGPDGNELWTSEILNAGNFVYSSRIVCDNAGNVFATGFTHVALPGSSGYVGEWDGFLIRLQ